MAVLDLCCCAGFSLVAVHLLLLAVAPLVAEHRLEGTQTSVAVARGLSSCASTGSVAVAHRPSCSVTRGIFPDQGSNQCPPALVGGFFTTEPPGKPSIEVFKNYLCTCPVGASWWYCKEIHCSFLRANYDMKQLSINISKLRCCFGYLSLVLLQRSFCSLARFDILLLVLMFTVKAFVRPEIISQEALQF